MLPRTCHCQYFSSCVDVALAFSRVGNFDIGSNYMYVSVGVNTPICNDYSVGISLLDVTCSARTFVRPAYYIVDRAIQTSSTNMRKQLDNS